MPRKTNKLRTRTRPVEKTKASSPPPGQIAAQAWADFEASYRSLITLLPRLPLADRNHYFALFQKLAEAVPCPWFVPLNAQSLAHFAELGIKQGIENAQRIAEAAEQVKDHYAPKPRMTARDDEVKRLRDQEQLDWDEILKRIRSNPDWEKDQSGKKVTKRALMAAYQRRKKKTAAE